MTFENIMATVIAIVLIFFILKAVKIIFKLFGFILLVVVVVWFVPPLREFVLGLF